MARKSSKGESKPSRSPNETPPEKGRRGAPIEHFRGEATHGQRVGDPGDLDEETLDRDAPFNKSYGLTDEDGSGPQR